VDELNRALRQVRVERGELGPGVQLETKHGPMTFAVGDRVQFTGTLRQARIYNGNAGTITAIEAGAGVLRAVLDGAGGPGREVSWSAKDLDGFRHGYAGTIYKGQGRTLDHTYLYHSHHWRQASSYVALTRQRESARIFAATETARDVAALARQMARGEERRASLAWATREELPAALRRAQVEGEGRGAGSPAGQEAAAATKSDQAQENASAPGQGWLIAPRLPAGGIDPGEVAAAVAASAEVQRGRRALGSYLEGAYRDPAAAMLRLEELVASHGPTSAAQRLVADPGQLGELRGRKGLLAGAAARQERARAERVAQAIGPAVARLGEAEAGAAAAWRKGVEARRAAEATGVPGLSARAQAAVGAITAAKDEAGRVKAWAGLQADKVVAGEVESFLRAVERRFGSEGMRALERSGTLEGARVGQAEHGSLRQVGGLVQALRGAQRAAAGQAQRLGATARMGQGARLKL
jgi:ATP-dependent exoDNAse (exonuclease V) alpha subunit